VAAFWRYGIWRTVQRGRSGGMRYWLPTLMVAAVAGIALTEHVFSSALHGVLLVVVLVVNFPVLLIVVLLLLPLGRLPAMVLAALGAAAGWFAWYGIVRFFEWRAASNGRISLNLG
jgi:hypothetical protein